MRGSALRIGLVGKPNVGKSTFFAATTLAKVDIANTLSPLTRTWGGLPRHACRAHAVNCGRGSSKRDVWTTTRVTEEVPCAPRTGMPQL